MIPLTDSGHFALALAAALALALLMTRAALAAGAAPLRPRGAAGPRPGGPETPKPRLKALGGFAAAAGVAVWIALSVMGSPGDDETSAPPPAEPEAPAPPPASQSLSFRIDPPPEVVTNPELPEEPPATEENPGGPAGAVRAVGGVFAPEELETDWPGGAVGLVRVGASEMAPVISRMEPVGRRLDPDNPVPKAERIELEPPDPAADPKPRRPRLSIPPPEAASPADSSAPSDGRRRYTIILGSFSKEDNAVRLRERLEGEGLPAEVISVVVNNQPWWRVMSGVFEDQAAAEAYGRELRRKNLVERPYIKIL